MVVSLQLIRLALKAKFQVDSRNLLYCELMYFQSNEEPHQLLWRNLTLDKVDK